MAEVYFEIGGVVEGGAGVGLLESLRRETQVNRARKQRMRTTRGIRIYSNPPRN